MRVVEVFGFADLEAIRVAWGELALASAHDTPYVLPEFMLPWLRRLDDRYSCRFLTAWEGDTLVGLAPVVERRIGRVGVTLTLLTFPEVVPSPPCDILVRGGVHGVEEAFLSHWLAQRDWDAIELANAPCESPAVARLAELAAAASLRVRRASGLEYFYVAATGSWEDYLASRSKTTRHNLRRGLRYFERLGETRIAAYPGDITHAQAMEQVFHVIGRSWKNDAEGPRSWNKFVRELIEEFDRSGLLRLSFLMLDAHAVAYLLDVPYKGSVYAIHNGYDLRFQPGNPGQLMLAHALEDAHRRGARRYDFTGDKDYLLRWTVTTRSYQRTRIRGRAAATWLKLRAYDWIHDRRVRGVLTSTDRSKEKKKHAGEPWK